jgi:2-oxo-3-hexenedioate decarboxylase
MTGNPTSDRRQRISRIRTLAAEAGFAHAQSELQAMSATKPNRIFDSATVDIDGIATDLMTAWRERSFVEAPSRRTPVFIKTDALAIRERVREQRIAAGAIPVGYKVGFTNGAVRAQFDAEGPIAATVYRETITPEPRIDAAPLLGPRIEPEIVVGIGVMGEIAWAALGFEIVQSHVRDWDFTYLDAIADFGLHAALIVGDRVPIDAQALPGWLTAMPVALHCNGTIVERGNTADVDGGALGSLAWLRADLARVGRELRPGEIVSTGSTTRVPPIHSGERWTIEAFRGELPSLTIDVL